MLAPDQFGSHGVQKFIEAIDALLTAARASRGPTSVIYTSGVWVLGSASAAVDETASTDRPAQAVAWRPAHERAVLDAAGGTLATARLLARHGARGARTADRAHTLR